MSMDEGRVKTILSAHINNSLGFFGGIIAKERIKAIQYYHGEAFGNEIEGRSQVVSKDVAEVVDGMMPSLMRIFGAGDKVVEFIPNKPGAEKYADQATDYVNWIWEQNSGFKVFQAWFKDALLQRLGIVKIWWEEKNEIKKDNYRGLTEFEYQMIEQDPDVEIVESSENQVTLIGPQGPTQQITYDCTVQRTKKAGRIKIAPVPPEEFLCERRAVSLDDTPFVAHRVKKTVSDLIEMGYDAETVKSIPAGGEQEYNMERLERFRQEDTLPYRNQGEYDDSMREVWVTECYLYLDYDQDGKAEYRKITVGGESEMVILDNEEVDGHPFAGLVPIIMPHKLYGVSAADMTMDLQLINSTLLRQALDNLYFANNKRVEVVEDQVNIDDLLTSRPGGVVRVKQPGMLREIETGDAATPALNMIEYINTVKEKRTGQSAYNQGLDANTLNKTAQGIAMIQDAGNARVELVARNFAESGVKDAFRKILELVCKHQKEQQVVRLRGQWMDMDPTNWDTEYDISVNVGLGTGSKERHFALMQQLLIIDQQIAQIQGGFDGPIVTLENFYNKLKKLAQSAGLRDTSPYYTDPASPEMQQAMAQKTQQTQQPPDPNLIKLQIAQIQAQAKEQQARLDMMTELLKQQNQHAHEHNMSEFEHAMGASVG